jgi:hypothetical protein
MNQFSCYVPAIWDGKTLPCWVGNRIRNIDEFGTNYLVNTTVVLDMEKPWVYMGRKWKMLIGLDEAVKWISVLLPHNRQYHFWACIICDVSV